MHHPSVSWHITCNFSAQTLIKRSPLKDKFWDIRVLGQNSQNSSFHFWKYKSRVPPQILHHSSVLWHITPLYFFGSNIIYFRQKQHIKVHILRLVSSRIEINQIYDVIFGTKNQFFFKLCITLQCHEPWFLCTFSSKPLYALDKRNPSKCKFSDFRLVGCKLTKFLMWFLRPWFIFFKFCITFSFITHNTYEIF